MRVTRFGLKAVVFYMMLVCAFFATPYLNLFFMLLTFCSTLAVLSVWWAHRNLVGVRGQLAQVHPTPAGASQLIRAMLSCPNHTRFDLVIEIKVAEAWHVMHDGVELHAGPEQPVDVMIPALPRGVHPVQQVRVRSQYPFGMIETAGKVTAPETITVYPAPADLVRYRKRGAIPGRGLGGAAAAEMGPSGLREFRDGDELRHVHWKASARRNDLVVKEFEGDAAPGVEVLLDLRVRGRPFEEALSLISALALECKSNMELFTLHAQEHRGTYGKGHTSFDTLFAYLAGVRPLTADSAPPPPVSPTVLRLPLGLPPATTSAIEEAPC